MELRVGVLGATGALGKEVINELIQSNLNVHALVRSVSKFSHIGDQHVTFSHGDLYDESAVLDFCTNVDAVICALGGPPPPNRDAQPLWPAFNNLIGTLETVKIPRFVMCSAWGVGDSRWRTTPLMSCILAPTLLRREYHDKLHQETILESSMLDWTIVRPTILNNTSLRPVHTVTRVPLINWVIPPFISRKSVARFMVDEIISPHFIRRKVMVTQPFFNPRRRSV